MVKQIVVHLTPTAQASYEKIANDAEPFIQDGDELHTKVQKLRWLDRAIDVTIPSDPFNPNRALAEPLSSIFIVSEGSLRIPYTGSIKDKRAVVVLCICDSPRNPLSLRDPVTIFTNMTLTGAFDEIFRLLGVKPFGRTISVRPIH